MATNQIGNKIDKAQAPAGLAAFNVPPFIEHDLELWFRFVDKVCATVNIVTQSAKLESIIGSLNGNQYS